ncbi:MAG TPA: hypothetical protein VHQ95_00880, partial [Pyrinomonadaceae bacterium]|nr:hypothetical protein [Pyrinomonadaceae bacterium]
GGPPVLSPSSAPPPQRADDAEIIGGLDCQAQRSFDQSSSGLSSVGGGSAQTRLPWAREGEAEESLRVGLGDEAIRQIAPGPSDAQAAAAIRARAEHGARMVV